jgi:hypothetical protein
MPTAEAVIETERPSRYLIQFCKHAAAMASTHGHRFRIHAGGSALARGEVRLHAEWSDTHGTVTFDPWGTCTLDADANTLTLRVDATDEENLHRIQDVITRDLDRFGRRDHLTANWHETEAPAVAPGDGPTA